MIDRWDVAPQLLPSRPVSRPRRLRYALRLLSLGVLALGLGGCFSVGPTMLRHDQVDYARSLAEARKRQTLANVVGLRFADAPAFLATTQVIAAYTFSSSGTATLTGAPGTDTGSAQLAGTVGYSNTPTFTFAPVTGDAYANAYIRPLAPSLILPLAQGGAPIDVLLRLTTQSIGDLQNSGVLGGAQSNGSPGFFECLHALRQLQIEGAMSIQFTADKGTDHVFLQLLPSADTSSDATRQAAATVRRLLKLQPRQDTFEIVYGQGSSNGQRVPVLTRSVLSILGSLGAQVEVPPAEIARHATMPTVRYVGMETRPVVIVHSGDKAPADAYVSTRYGNASYWIDANDFDSKYAFNVLQNIMSLAEADQSKQAPVVTIPAG